MKFISILTIILTISSYTFADPTDIRINQIGYYPNQVKNFIVANSNATTFDVKNTNGTIVFTGNLIDQGNWNQSGEDVKIGDFTSYTEKGKYTISVSDKGNSYVFEIGSSIMLKPMIASLKGFYYQRASLKLEEQYAGKWYREAGHPDTDCVYHESSGKTAGILSSPKGWYDAGDYNKYVVNAGITVGTMLQLHELYPDIFNDNVNIPESNNGVSDLLDEVKYELDWLLTMQDNDGGVFFKITTKNFSGFVLPKEATATRYVVGKSTTSALDFAAMMGMAGRIYKNIDAVYAQKCVTAAESAWNWAQIHPDITFKNPDDINTGEYGDTRYKDEFLWAASELLITTKKDMYKTYVSDNISKTNIGSDAGWQNVTNLAFYSLIMNNELLSTTDADYVKTSIIDEANDLLSKIKEIPYRIPSESFWWGSNAIYLNQAILLAYAYKVTGENKYLTGVIETNDYIFGKNATGYSFVTGVGDKTPMHPHHRPSEGDDVTDPVPGLVVGGPNGGQQDGVSYSSDYDAQSYEDVQPSYASNEIAINWNAPLVFVTSFIQANVGDKTAIISLRNEINSKKLIIYPNPVTNIVNIKSSINGEIVIMNLQEKIIKIVNNNKMDLSKLKKGIYFAVVKRNGKIKSVKSFYKR